MYIYTTRQVYFWLIHFFWTECPFKS